MGEGTAIEWATHTFNPWIGCTKVSPACANCYAETYAHRYGRAEWGKGNPRSLTSEANWRKPLAWNRKAERTGIRPRVFCASLGDVFDEEVPDEWRDRLFDDLIDQTPHLDWLLLTKRPEQMRRYLNGRRAPRPNVWAGVTVEDQQRADERIPILLDTPAAKRFLSCEPLLGPIDFAKVPGFNRLGLSLHGWWVIAGGESGAHARPSNPDWFRSLRNQCVNAGVPFLFKQWGEWAPYDPRRATVKDIHFFGNSKTYAYRVGKKRAGRFLDGVLHDGVPS